MTPAEYYIQDRVGASSKHVIGTVLCAVLASLEQLVPYAAAILVCILRHLAAVKQHAKGTAVSPHLLLLLLLGQPAAEPAACTMCCPLNNASRSPLPACFPHSVPIHEKIFIMGAQPSGCCEQG
jgi:hypothetical protein